MNSINWFLSNSHKQLLALFFFFIKWIGTVPSVWIIFLIEGIWCKKIDQSSKHTKPIIKIRAEINLWDGQLLQSVQQFIHASITQMLLFMGECEAWTAKFWLVPRAQKQYLVIRWVTDAWADCAMETMWGEANNMCLQSAPEHGLLC